MDFLCGNARLSQQQLERLSILMSRKRVLVCLCNRRRGIVTSTLDFRAGSRRVAWRQAGLASTVTARGSRKELNSMTGFPDRDGTGTDDDGVSRTWRHGDWQPGTIGLFIFAMLYHIGSLHFLDQSFAQSKHYVHAQASRSKLLWAFTCPQIMYYVLFIYYYCA